MVQTERLILHSDLNNFYATAEAVRRPDLRGLPIAVAGNPENRHGIVLAKSCEARAMGVATGEALWQAREKCPNIIFIPPDFEYYAYISAKIRRIYEEYTDRVEAFGPDECWLDVTGSIRLFCGRNTSWEDSAHAFADTVRNRVKRETGLTVSVGASFNKTTAKLASDMKKPDAVTVIPRRLYREMVWCLPVTDMLFVGGKTAEKLKLYGIDTIGGLASADDEFLRLLLGKNGFGLKQCAVGAECEPVLTREELPQVKSVSCGETLPRDIHTSAEVGRVLLKLCENVSSRLRKLDLEAACVHIGIRRSDLSDTERQATLASPSRTCETIHKAAMKLFLENVREGSAIRALTVRASRLGKLSARQLNMFSDEDKDGRREELEACVDSLRRKYGVDILQRGSLMGLN